MEELADAVDSLKYLVARPGTFGTLFPETTDDMLAALLLDGFAEAQLMGLLSDHVADEDGIVSPEIDSGQAALVTIFAAVRFLRAELINRNFEVTYKAGSAEYHTVQSSTLLRDILASLEGQKKTVIDTGMLAGVSSAFYMADQYLARAYEMSGSAEVIGW